MMPTYFSLPGILQELKIMTITEVKKNFVQKKNWGIPFCFDKSRTECPIAVKKHVMKLKELKIMTITEVKKNFVQKKIGAFHSAKRKAEQNAQ